MAPSIPTCTQRAGCLEGEFQCKLQRTHHHWVVARVHNVQDLPIVPATIDAGTSGRFVVLSAKVKDRVVEKIEHVHPELGVHALCEFEIFCHSSVIGKHTWSTEGIAAGVTNRSASRQAERTRSRPW